MKKLILVGIVGMMGATSASAWNAAYECVSNDAKKAKVTVSFLDSEVLRTREGGSIPDRYYRVTDSSEELVEAMILGHKSGEKARLVPVLKGTMNLTMTALDANTVTASVKVGKVLQTYTCR